MTNLHMPGGILVSRLRVYDTPAPDGQRGGTPHVHLLCSEMYYTLSGSGAVEMIDINGFQRVEIAAGDALVFSPGTVHRLINPNGDLEILVIMQNSGLPERGDNVVSFSERWLADDEAYAGAMKVESLADAYRRRDRGVEGFLRLKAAFDAGPDAGREALERFYALAEARTRLQRAEWEAIVRAGPKAVVDTTLDQLDYLNRHDTRYLLEARHQLVHAGRETLGFCGHLRRYFDPASLTLEGLKDG